MKTNELYRDIEKLEREILYLNNDYKKLLHQNNAFYEMKDVRLKIKQAEESLRLKRRMTYLPLN